MAAGQGFKTFTTGEVLTAGDVNGYLMQGVLVFASAAARDAAITSPQEGQFAFTKDTNGLWYYDGAAWVASGATGDIEGVTAGVGISGGGTSGTVTITNSMATAIDAKGDLVAGTGADTFAKLTVGANNTILTADSTTATGLKWATPAGGGGKVLQVIQATTTTSTTIASTTQTDTNLTATITPTLSTSKVLVLATSPANLYRGTTGGGQNEQNIRYALLRDATSLTGGTSINAIRIIESSNAYDAIDTTVFFTITYLDSPNTTAATTYKIQASASTTNQSGSISFQYGGGFGSVTLLEIGA
jgi:hypothetical protein